MWQLSKLNAIFDAIKKLNISVKHKGAEQVPLSSAEASSQALTALLGKKRAEAGKKENRSPRSRFSSPALQLP